MSPNQRLMFAVVVSIVFFIAYSTIFPHPQNEQMANIDKKEGTAPKSVQQGEQNSVATPQQGGVSQNNASQNVVVNESSKSDILVVKSDEFVLKVDTLGCISSKELLQDKFNNKDGEHAQVIQHDGIKPLYIRFEDAKLNNEAISTPYSASVSELDLQGSAKKVTLTQKLSSVVVTKELTFYPDGHYDIEISLSNDKRYYIYLGKRPKVNKKEQAMSATGVMIYTSDELLTIIEDGDAEGRETFSGVELTASFDQYTAIVMYGFSKDEIIIVERDRDDNPVAYFQGLKDIKLHGYIGPKEYKVLKDIKPVLTHVVEYGWFTFAAKPLFQLLSYLHGIFGNWGWAIVALTLVIRLILYPLTYKGMMSMQKIKELAPKLKEIKEKYKGDPQRTNAATMELYKKHNANPLGGCLPMLLQIPVFYAIYRLLLNSVELQGAPWVLWIDDLSRMDPYYILPLLMGASMFLQQRLTPQNFTDPMQEKIMKYLPVIFTFFFLTFPSGLVLYWFVNNIFSILQQFIVNQQFENQKDAKKAIEKNKEQKVTGKKDD